MSEEIKLVKVDSLAFGREIITHESHSEHGDNTVLGAVQLLKFSDNQGVFFVPAVASYVYYDKMLITGNDNGYKTRAEALKCVGRCWDKAENDLAERIAKSKK